MVVFFPVPVKAGQLASLVQLLMHDLSLHFSTHSTHEKAAKTFMINCLSLPYSCPCTAKSWVMVSLAVGLWGCAGQEITKAKPDLIKFIRCTVLMVQYIWQDGKIEKRTLSPVILFAWLCQTAASWQTKISSCLHTRDMRNRKNVQMWSTRIGMMRIQNSVY